MMSNGDTREEERIYKMVAAIPGESDDFVGNFQLPTSLRGSKVATARDQKGK